MTRAVAVRAAVLLAALAVPASAPSALGPRYGGTLRVGVIELPALDPAPPRSSDERLLAGMAHATLVTAGPEGQPLPELAAGWSSAASGREWTLRLREAAFHDGAPLTADDAVRSLRRFLRSGSPAAGQMAAALAGGAAFRQGAADVLPGVEARGPRTVVLRFDAARPLALAPLASPAAAITSTSGAGAGPFAPSAVIAGRRAAFAAAAMHLRGRPYLDRVELTVVPEAALGAELQAGRVDLALNGGGGPLAGVLLLLVDAARPPFDRAPVRAAVAAAVDRANLVRHLLPGGEAGAALLPPVLLPPLGTDTPRPAADAPRSPTTLAVSREVPSLVSQRVVAHLSDLGLQVAAEPRAPARVLGGPPAALRLWIWSPEVAEPGLALQELAALLPPQPAASEALAAAAAEMDLDRRRALLYRAEAALRATGLLVPLAAVPVSYRAAPRLQDVRVDTAGRVALEDAWWEP